MSRTRKYGMFAAIVASAGLVAGCGGSGGYTAAESSPTGASGTDPAAAGSAAAPAAQPGADAVGRLAPADPARAEDAKIRGYERFSRDRARTIFVSPIPDDVPTDTSGTPASPGGTPPTTTVPTSPTNPSDPAAPPSAPSTPSNPSTPQPAPVTTSLSASIDINGTVETVKIGAQIPSSSPAFVVQAIEQGKVTLALISGTVPGGTSTIDLVPNVATTLTNPTTGQSYTVTVLEVKAEV